MPTCHDDRPPAAVSRLACLGAVALLAGGTLVAQEPAAAARAKLVERGREVYTANKCQTCHSIEGVGGKRSALDGVGSRLGREDLRQWIVAPSRMNPKVRKPSYARMAEADLDALVEYLASLRAKEPD